MSGDILVIESTSTPGLIEIVTPGPQGPSISVNSVPAVAGNVTLTKADINLSNVDNTSDVNKPVSTAQATALALKVDIASTSTSATANTVVMRDAVGSIAAVGVTADSLALGSVTMINQDANSVYFGAGFYNLTTYAKTGNYAIRTMHDSAAGVINFDFAPIGTAGNPITWSRKISMGIGGDINIAGASRYGSSYTSYVSGDNSNLYFGIGNAEKMRLDTNGNLGIGVTLSPWASGYKAIDIGGGGAVAALNGNTLLSNNLYDNYGWRFKVNGSGQIVYLGIDGGMRTYAATGAAGAVASLLQTSYLDAAGNFDVTSTIKPGSYTVATLPSGSNGKIAYASNGRKVGEGSGAGTGIPVYYSNSAWRVFGTDAVVAS